MFWLIDTIVVRPIVNILFIIYNYIGDFGLAIIIFTIIVKLCMWPLMKSQLRQTKLMRKLQPELAQIKKNCNGNRQLESLQTMDLYKRYNVKPFRSTLSLFIQLPIFIALFAGISAIANPRPVGDGGTCGYTNVENCAYPFVHDMSRVGEVIDLQQPYLENPQEHTYDFKPQLFGVIDLSTRAGFSSISAAIIFVMAILSALAQYIMTRQQLPSGKSEKRKTFRQLMKEASDGKDPDQAELNNLATAQMGKIMPFMMLLIMINLPGALVFYYLITNLITIIQQKIIFSRDEEEMEISADKTVLKELKNIKEGEIVKNKKSGTKITRITAKDSKKRNKS
ncbi:membrane protein insertase YidC [Candidatus Saccharibacteria bacterium]|nr:membrane protein insertase YidC [Candidatus Saccharibacteria bacterium]